MRGPFWSATIRPGPLVVLVLVTAALAGCTGEEPSVMATPSPSGPGPVGGGTTVTGGSGVGATPTPLGSGDDAASGAGSPVTPPPPPSPALLSIAGFSADRGRVLPGDAVHVTVTIQNAGGTAGTGSAWLIVDGVEGERRAFEVLPEASQSLSFSVVLAEAGDHHIALGSVPELEAGPLTVRVGPTGVLELSNAAATPASVELGDFVHLSVDVRNTGDSIATGQLRARDGQTLLGTTDVSVEPGATKRYSVAFVPTDGGTRTFSLDVASSSGALDVPVTVRAPRLAHATGTFVPEFCLSHIQYSVSFDNVGDGLAKETKALAVVYDATGAEHSRAELALGTIIAGAHHEATLMPPATNRCGQDDVYSIVVTITPKFGEAVSVRTDGIVI